MNQLKGTFVISIDFEYALGYADEDLSPNRQDLVRAEADISKKILKLFEKYKTPATWAIVGHLLETDCSVKDKRFHSNFPEQMFSDRSLDWFKHHPCVEQGKDDLWFDTAGVIKEVSNSQIEHDIGSHSYAHILYGDKGIKREAVITDLQEVQKIHDKNDLPLESFIFPRNMEGYHEELRKIGIKCYRGESKFWYMRLGGFVRRLARLFDYYLPNVKTVLPSKHESGLINIPDSLLLLGRNGLRKLVLPSVMKRKIKKGLDQAVKNNEVFHLWFHPSNFSYDTDTQLEILEHTLEYASNLRNKGLLGVSTMKMFADKE